MRTYGDACGITRALDLIGERWALPVVRELLLGPRRYSDLREALPGISTNILGSRLKELTEAGVVHRRRLDRKSTRLNSSHVAISYAVFCLKKKKGKTRYKMDVVY